MKFNSEMVFNNQSTVKVIAYGEVLEGKLFDFNADNTYIYLETSNDTYTIPFTQIQSIEVVEAVKVEKEEVETVPATFERLMTNAKIESTKKKFTIENRYKDITFTYELDDSEEVLNVNLNAWDIEENEIIGTWLIAEGTDYKKAERLYKKLSAIS